MRFGIFTYKFLVFCFLFLHICVLQEVSVNQERQHILPVLGPLVYIIG